MDEYASCFDSIDPLAQYKNWRVDSQKSSSKTSISSQRVKAAFIVSDPIDWGRDIQVSIIFSHSISSIYIALILLFMQGNNFLLNMHMPLLLKNILLNYESVRQEKMLYEDNRHML